MLKSPKVSVFFLVVYPENFYCKSMRLVIAQMLIYSSEPVYYGHHVTYYHDTPILIKILFHYDDKT